MTTEPHRSTWTGQICRREEITGKPCDGVGHVTAPGLHHAPDFVPTAKVTKTNQPKKP